MTAGPGIDMPGATSTLTIRPLHVRVCLLLGVSAAAAGLLPWLITGLRLPLQNLWAASTAPDDMPLVLLPFSQYAISLIAAVLVTGGVIAGCVARALHARLPRHRFSVLLVGVLLVQVIALVQTAVVVRNGLRQGVDAEIYLAALVGVSVLSIVLGAVSMVLIARASRAGVVIGATLAALLFGHWVVGLVVPFGSIASDGTADVLRVVRWITPVLIGLVIAWAGVYDKGRVIVAATSLLALWIIPALITAVSSAAGTRVYARDPSALLDLAQRVFTTATTTPSTAVPPLLVALTVAAAGLLIRRQSGYQRRR